VGQYIDNSTTCNRSLTRLRVVSTLSSTLRVSLTRTSVYPINKNPPVSCVRTEIDNEETMNATIDHQMKMSKGIQGIAPTQRICLEAVFHCADQGQKFTADSQSFAALEIIS
jgi:hypothetical protein